MSKLSSSREWEKAETLLSLFVLLPLLFVAGCLLGFLVSHII
jgi:hypothetical protein